MRPKKLKAVEPIEKRVAVTLAVVAAAVLALVWAAYRWGYASIEASAWVAHTEAVRAELEGILADVSQVRVSTDGFLVSGEEADLILYRASREQLRQGIDTLRQMTSDNPRQQELSTPLEKAIVERLRILDDAISLRRRAGPEAVLEDLRSVNARTVSQTVQKSIAQMIAEEEGLLRKRKDRTDVTKREATAALISLIAVVLLLLGAVCYILDRDVQSRRWAHQALRKSADELRDLYDNAPCGYCSLDPQGVFLQINATLLGWLDYRSDEIAQKMNFRDLLTPESAQRFETSFTGFKLHGRIDELALDMVREQGAVLPILLAATALYDRFGHYLSCRATVFDITERKRAEAALEQLGAVVNSSDEAIIRKTPEGIIASWNKGAERLYGYSAEEVIGKSASLLLAPGRENELASTLAALRQGRTIDHQETVRKRKDGRLIDVSVAVAAIKDAAGHLTGAAIVAHDITARKRAEQKFRGLLEAAPDAVVVADAKGKIILANAQVERLFGYSREDLLGEGIEMLVPRRHWHAPSDGPTRLFDDSGARHNGVGPELYGLHKNGREFPVEISFSPFETEEGLLVSSAIRDITERRRIEQELRDYSAAMRVQASLLEIAGDSIIVRDFHEVISFWNRAAEKTYGWSKEEAIGQVSHVLLQTQFPQPLPEIEAVLLRDGRWEGELNHTRRDGTRLVVASRWVVQRDESGEPWRIMEIDNDISDRLRVDQEIRNLNTSLENRNAELIALNKEMESFSYSVSHDLRAPLRAIDGFSQALVEDCQERLHPEEKRHLERIRAAASRMGQLIDDLLSLGRTTRSDLVPVEVNLSNIASEIASQLHNSQPERAVTFVIAPDVWAVGDRGLLRAVLDNLLGNSWKFTSKQAEARIEFGVQLQNDQKLYFIKDNGAGFDMKYASKLFGAFQRLHADREFPGTGIGLATVQRVVRRHRGRVWAEAMLGQGATFYFALWENKNDSAG